MTRLDMPRYALRDELIKMVDSFKFSSDGGMVNLLKTDRDSELISFLVNSVGVWKALMKSDSETIVLLVLSDSG